MRCAHVPHLLVRKRKKKHKKATVLEKKLELILSAFITGNNSLESLPGGFFAEIHIDLS